VYLLILFISKEFLEQVGFERVEVLLAFERKQFVDVDVEREYALVVPLLLA